MLTRLLAAAATVVVAAAGPAPAASVSQSFTVPAGGRFTVTGHGFGHGHGMSQHGADGAAARGLTHQQILGFYYPGTTLTRAAGFVRVRLTGLSSTVVVDAQPGLQVGDTRTHRWVSLAGSPVTQWRLGVASARTVVDYRKAGTWHRWRTLAGDGVLRSTSGTLALRDGSARRLYRDRLTTGASGRAVVNILPLESYVRGVVAREMPASWHAEAVQAQAVAARTYAVWSREQSATICDTAACQVYAGVAGEHPLADRAVRATAGQVLTYRGRPVFAEFSASSGGWTSAGDAPYLVAKSDPYDGVTASSAHTWSQQVDVRTLQRAYPGVGTLRRLVVTERQGPISGGPQWGGRANRVDLVGTRATVSISGTRLRSVLGLRSTWVWFRA